MTTWAQVDADNKVIDIVEAENLWDVQWAEAPLTWLNVEVTQETGIPRVGDRYVEGKFISGV